ncbi:hypothetical protein CR513_31852, partial [Mucuna pruriens]
MPAQGNSPSLEDLMKQLATSNLEFQQTMSSISQYCDQLQSTRSSNLPSQTILNPRGNVSAVILRSRKALSQPAPQQLSRAADADSELDADSQALQ